LTHSLSSPPNSSSLSSSRLSSPSSFCCYRYVRLEDRCAPVRLLFIILLEDHPVYKAFNLCKMIRTTLSSPRCGDARGILSVSAFAPCL
jgi:hypothetical protein